MKDTDYRPETLENPDIAQEDIPETPAEAEAMPVILPELSESRPVAAGEPAPAEPRPIPPLPPESREVVLTYLQPSPREVVEYYLHKARLPGRGGRPGSGGRDMVQAVREICTGPLPEDPAPTGIDWQLAQALREIRERPVPEEKPRRRKKGLWITLALLLVIALIAGAFWYFGREGDAPNDSREPYPGYEQTAEDETITIPTCEARGDLRVLLSAGHGEALTAEEIYARVNPATVTVVCNVSETSASVGTGVIFTEDGYLLTNHHVVAGGKDCTVTLSDNIQYEARYVVSDEVNDLAVLKIVDGHGLPTAELGDSSLLTVGETVYAIGNPLGVELRGTFTDGLVSALDRDVDVDGRTMTLIQTNAALNSGNSGGPLINQYGQVVGINTIKMMSEFSNIEGLGFAIPTQAIRRVVNQLLKEGAIPPEPLLGITVDMMGTLLPDGRVGARIHSVSEGSAGDRAGLQADDIIVEAGGQEIRGSGDVLHVRKNYRVGDQLPMTVYRDGEYLEVVLDLQETAD